MVELLLVGILQLRTMNVDYIYKQQVIMPANCSGWNDYIEKNNELQNKDWLKRVMFCESTCRPGASNGLGNHGLMQFDYATWNENCSGNILNGKDQLKCADNLYSKGQSWRWQCK